MDKHALDLTVKYRSDNQSFNLISDNSKDKYENFSTYSSFYDHYYPHIEKYLPVYVSGYQPKEQNKTEQAFKAVGKLVAEGYLKEVTLKEFIELVDLVAKELN